MFISIRDQEKCRAQNYPLQARAPLGDRLVRAFWKSENRLLLLFLQ